MKRRLKSLGWVGVGALAVILLAWGAATIDTALRQRVDENRLTKIESPCLRYGAKSEQCKEAFEQAVLTITHAEACAILRKAGLEVVSCAHARLRQEHRRHNERAATRAAKEVVPQQPHSTAHQQPGPHHGGGGHSGGGTAKGGNGPPPAPGNSGSGGGSVPAERGTGAEQSPGPQPLAVPELPVSPPDHQPAGDLPEAVGNVVAPVEGATGTVRNTACSVNAAGIEVCP